MGERIAVVGATGYTGRLVVQELAGRGVEVLAVGRNHDKLRALRPAVDSKVVPIADVDAVAEALDGCDSVVNCVGSFVDFGEAVVIAAIAAGVPYVDTSAEFPFLRRVFEHHDGPARTAGVAVVPGMAFYSAPADLAAALAAQKLGRPPQTTEVAYHLVGARPSRGTLRTNLRRVGQPCPVWADGRLVSHRIGDDRRRFAFPEPYGPRSVARWPGGETLTIPRHTGARSVAVFLGMPKVAAAVLRRPRLTAVLQRAGRLVVGESTEGPSDEARAQARFVVVADARSAAGNVARCVVEGHDLYGVTAAAAADAAQRLGSLAGSPSGVLSPAEAFDPANFLDGLSSHLSWHLET